MTTALEATDKDFERMMQMLSGFFVTQIAGAVASSITSQRDLRLQNRSPRLKASIRSRLFVYCARVRHLDW